MVSVGIYSSLGSSDLKSALEMYLFLSFPRKEGLKTAILKIIELPFRIITS